MRGGLLGDDDEDEMQGSVLSVLGGEREMAEMADLVGEMVSATLRARADQGDQLTPETVGVLTVAKLEEELPLHTATLPIVMPTVKLQPPTAASTPVLSATTPSELAAHIQAMQELHPPPVLSPPSEVEDLTQYTFESTGSPAADTAEGSVTGSDKTVKTEPKDPVPPPPSERPTLLYGGAALVALVGVAVYAYCRK